MVTAVSVESIAGYVLSDPQRVLEIAVHEVGHFALACAKPELPRGIRVGDDGFGGLGMCFAGSGGGWRYSTSSRSGSAPGSIRVTREHELRAAMIDVAGIVAEARLYDDEPWDRFCDCAAEDDYEEKGWGDIRNAFASCAWVLDEPAPFPCLLSSALPPSMSYRPKVWNLVGRTLRRCDAYLEKHWAVVMRMARALARRPVVDGFRELTERSVYRWAPKFPGHEEVSR